MCGERLFCVVSYGAGVMHKINMFKLELAHAAQLFWSNLQDTMIIPAAEQRDSGTGGTTDYDSPNHIELPLWPTGLEKSLYTKWMFAFKCNYVFK